MAEKEIDWLAHAVCRFRVTQKTELEHYEKASVFRIILEGVKSGTFEEAIPAANIEMLMVPKDAADTFKVGYYYLAHFVYDQDQMPSSNNVSSLPTLCVSR